MEILSWIIWIGFVALAVYNYNIALSVYLTLKLFLLKAWTLLIVTGLPLITMDRGLFVVLLILFFIHHKKHKFKSGNLPLLVPWLILILGHLLVVFAHLNQWYEGVKGILIVGVEYFCLFYIIVLSYTQRSDFKHFVQIYGSGVLLILVYGLYTKMSGQNAYIDYFKKLAVEMNREDLVFIYNPKGIRYGILGRVQSFIFHPIAYAGLIALWLPFTFNYLWIKKGWIQKVALLAFSGLAITNLILANARSGLIAAIIALIPSFWFVYKYKENRSNKIIAGSIVGLCVLLISLNVGGTKHLLKSTLFFWEKTEVIQGSTLDDRIAKFEYVTQDISDKIWFGNGHGAVAKAMDEGNEGVAGSESFWLNTLFELGLVGTIAYLIFFGFIFWHFIKWLRFVGGKKGDLLLIILFVTLGYFMFITATGELNTFAAYISIVALCCAYFKNEVYV